MSAGLARARRRTEWSNSAVAFLLIAALAAVQFLFLGLTIASQRDGAHIIDVSGAQRMRVQRIAFLAIDAHAGSAAAGWRAELGTTIANMRAVKRELLASSLTRTVPLGRDGNTPLGRMTERYLRAAEAILRDVADRAAQVEIRRSREPLSREFEQAVGVRIARLQRQHDVLLAAVVGALVALMAVMFAAWRLIVVPAERKTQTAMAALIDSRRQFRSLFQDYPEAIAVYDLCGRIERANRAAIALFGHSAERLSGAHFTAHLAPESVAGAWAGFERAVAGDTVSFETVLIGADGERIDVATSLFPSVVKGDVAGVFGVAKDIRPLKEVQSSYEEQANRMAALYEVASGRGRSWEQQITAALTLAFTHLRGRGAFLTEVSDGAATIRATAGESVQRAVDLPIVSVPVRAGADLYGTVTLVAARPGPTSLSAADRDFFGLVSALIGSVLERGMHERKLDTLAFFDALTGLPNRALLDDRLAALIADAEPHQTPFAVHYLDLDRFKEVNDNFGHAVGDRVLQIAADRMRDVLRPTDTVARIGGDEFVILQPAAHDRRSAADVGDRLLVAIARPFVVAGVSHQLGASIGISLYPDDGGDGKTLLRQADNALYRAKNDGRNRLRFVA